MKKIVMLLLSLATCAGMEHFLQAAEVPLPKPRSALTEKQMRELEQRREQEISELETLPQNALEKIAESLGYNELVFLMRSSPILNNKLKDELKRREPILYWGTAQFEQDIVLTDYSACHAPYLLTFSPDGKLLAAIYWDPDVKFIKVWDLEKKEIIEKFIYTGELRSLSFMPDGNLATFEWDEKNHRGTVRIRNLKGHELKVAHIENIEDTQAYSAAFSPDGTLLAVGFEDFTLRVWDLQKLLAKKDEPPIKVFRVPGGKHYYPFDRLEISPVGNMIASSSSGEDYAVRLWDLQRDEPIKIITSGIPESAAISFSPDGKLLASVVSSDVILWDVQSGEQVNNFITVEWGRELAFLPDGKRIATVSYKRPITIWKAVHTKK